MGRNTSLSQPSALTDTRSGTADVTVGADEVRAVRVFVGGAGGRRRRSRTWLPGTRCETAVDDQQSEEGTQPMSDSTLTGTQPGSAPADASMSVKTFFGWDSRRA